MNANALTKIPISFEVIESIDDRFMKVKIKLMHLGHNLNGSYFSKEVVLKALPTLANTPILGYVTEDENGEKEFNGHEVELVIKDGEYQFRYLGVPYGVIPESCNARFEFENDLEYLVVDGLIWTKMEDAVEILTRNGKNSQSMELHDNYSGFFRDDNYFEFTDFSFYGACILGDSRGIQPAMIGASIEPIFSYDSRRKVDEILKQKVNEYCTTYSHIIEKYFQSMEVKHVMGLKELLDKYSTTEDELKEKGVNVEEYSIEELEAKLEELFANNEVDEQTENQKPTTTMENNENDEVGKVDDEDDKQDFSQTKNKENNEAVKDKFAIVFELSHEDIRKKMYDQIDNHMNQKGYGEDWYYIVKVYETYLIAEKGYGDKFYKIDYYIENDNVILADVIEVFPMFLTEQEKNALELMRNSFDKLKEENTELKEFKASVIKEQHEAQAEKLFEQFNKLTEDEIADLRENVHNYTIEELESRLFERLGRKMANFSKEQKRDNKINFSNSFDNNHVFGYIHLFKKHGFIK